MFYVEEIALIKSAKENSYTINTKSRMEVEAIMDKIYNENPSYWPEGLQVKGHDDLYMVRSASTDEPAGFVGWQMRKEGNTRIGYYTIGILPQFRRNGMAKEAITKLLRKKAHEVDVVRAYIAPHNKPSLELAENLGIAIEKSASWKPLVAGGLGNAAFWDMYNQDTKNPFTKKYWTEGADPGNRIMMAVLNAGLGAGGGHLMAKGDADSFAKGIGVMALSPVKDWVAGSLPAAHKLPKAIDNLSKGTAGGMSSHERLALLGLGGLGLTAGTVGSMMLLRRLKGLENAAQQVAGSRMKVTLPTKKPGDQETTIDMPLDKDVDLSNLAEGKLQRDVRRKIREESEERTVKRPKKKKPANAPQPAEDQGMHLFPSVKSTLGGLQNLMGSLYNK